jgi:hypothetical protein
MAAKKPSQNFEDDYKNGHNVKIAPGRDATAKQERDSFQI